MTTTTLTPRKKRIRWLRLVILCFLGFCGLVLVLLQQIVSPILRQKLEATVAAHLDASLKIGAIIYRPPFTVHLFGVRFLAHPKQPGGGTELLAARQIDLSLAQLPFGSGPLVIQRFALDGVTLHVIKDAGGSFVGLDLAKPSNEPASPVAMKLSDVLRLRHFSLKDGTLIYQDQSDARASPTQWHGVTSDIALAPQSASRYGFQLDAADAPLAKSRIEGTLDVDSLMLQISGFKTTVQSSGKQTLLGLDQLPRALRDWIHEYDVKGTITLAATGSIPLKNPDQGSCDADLIISGGAASLPDGGEKLDDLALSTHIEYGTSRTNSGQVKIQLRNLGAISGGAILHLESAVALIDSDGNWSINGASGALDAPVANHGPWGLTGHADFHADAAHDARSNQTPFVANANLIGIDLAPPGLAAPLQELTGTIHFAGNDASDRQIDFQNLSALYGGDHLTLAHALVNLGQFPDRILVSDIRSHLDLVQNSPECPGDLGPILDAFAPSGGFDIVGTAAMQHVIRDDGPGYSPEWNLDISTENGALALFDQRLPVTALNGHMLATKHAISIQGLRGTVLGGPMDLVAVARVMEPIVYQGEFNLLNANVAQLVQISRFKTSDGTLPTGSGSLRLKFFSSPPTPATGATVTQATSGPSDEADEWLSLLAGNGSLQIDNGNLWGLPVLQSLSRRASIARSALTAGEAAALFSIANRKIYFKRLAIYSPALGLQGSGSETFSGKLDLDIIAAPLGDWKHKLSETDIPFFSSVVASAAGSIEKFVGSATSALLYHFRITGTRENPQVETIPAPFITDGAANLFDRMLHHDGSTKLVDAVNEK